ncbi:MAG: DUF2141 domain-containing protein [Lentimicrobiaceae bacterium]|jgi:uncharacterized protein (DUF2141 family)|nr:DUF2141 domain-containing protein [Lentimicrobiaceae bacterium]MCP4911218.1 DUF2141 domain-containing protein [Bacteroidota bacterium]MBT3454962.1 DUF2141 domain-containing protein [Lentimicrobiaceae bacterium]MBT3818412.1 DUF2141 domain-containing protein [Lentimicrobiaceae bacterium]MBT4060780.1 DUF2141 domain-containing protein [Lentimicrobiaceae bacterium]
MRDTILIILMSITSTFVFAQDNIILTLEVKNIKSFDTKLYVGIYDNKKDFKNKSHTIDSAIIIPKTETVKLTFTIKDAGMYAAAGFQDLNGNKKLDTGIFGIPIEPVCVSDYNHKPKSPPTFIKSEFMLKSDTVIVMPLMSGNKEIEKLEKKF